MRLAGLLAVVAAAFVAAIAAPRVEAAAACKQSPDAEQYPLLVRNGPLRVYGGVGDDSSCFPWRMCPDHPLIVNHYSLPATAAALRAALPVIIQRRPGQITFTFPSPFDRGLLLRLCYRR